MIKYLCLIGVIVAAVSATPMPKTCAANEELVVRLGKISCENTCANPTIGHSCTAVISAPTCRCKQGYLRNSKGECVLPADCNACPPNEVLVVKLGKIPCENTCASPNRGASCTALINKPTCRCKSGYYRNSKGKCVLAADCDACPPNEILIDRLGKISCENTCVDPTRGTRCTAFISGPTCRCKDGYLRNSKGQCVLPEDCDNCPENEMLINRTGKISCENTCVDPTLGTRCTALLSGPTCRCKPDYYRSSTGKCISLADCANDLTVIPYNKKEASTLAPPTAYPIDTTG
ncbi:mucin-2-like isoform X2 [Arctopsyche grandis]|uniref:mucin-2-like isoform X2 n=1 Tax=Arctopsyche grandis TaxID=121162 RepID=UPI00406D6BFE